MKKILIPILLFMIMGCSRNEVTVTNGALYSVVFLFRGESNTIPSGSTVKIEKVPDGSFNYSTTYAIPSGVTATAGSGLSGTMSFDQHDTKYFILYSSVLDSTTYSIDANISTNAN